MAHHFTAVINEDEFSLPVLHTGHVNYCRVKTEGSSVIESLPVLLLKLNDDLEVAYLLPSFNNSTGSFHESKFGGLIIGYELRSDSHSPEGIIYFKSEQGCEVAVKISAVSKMREKNEGGYVRVQKKYTENPFHEIAVMQLLRNDQGNLPGKISKNSNCLKNLHAGYVDERYVMNIMKSVPHCIDTYYYNFPSYERPPSLQVTRASPQPHEQSYFLNKLKEARVIFRELMKAVAELHAFGVAHRDISLENVVLSIDPHASTPYHIQKVLLIDYGMATRHPSYRIDEKMGRDNCMELPGGNNDMSEEDAALYYQQHPQPFYGKKDYAPPECFIRCNGATVDPRSSDIWACGIFLFIFLYNEPPVLDVNDINNSLISSIPNRYRDQSVMNLFQKMLIVAPQNRISAENILLDPFCSI